MRRFYILGMIVALVASVLTVSSVALDDDPAQAAVGAFHNPIASVEDPSIVTDGGYYYLIGTSVSNQLTVQRSTTIGGLNSAPKTVVWSGPASGLGSALLWSPVIYKLQGLWYIYLSVTDSTGPVAHAAIYALQSSTSSPLGPYTIKSTLKSWDTGVNPAPWEKGLVGPAILEMPNGDLYLTTTTFGFYIQPMSNPWTLQPGSSMTTINTGAPTLAWEGGTGEIARPIVHTVAGVTQVFVPYSSENHVTQRTDGGPCWSFCVGMFQWSSGSLTSPASWTKAANPVFAGGPTSGLFRVLALNTFRSLDGTEDWIVYNSNDTAGTEFEQRYTFAQKMTWLPSGLPSFGSPTPLATAITVPSGEVTPAADRVPGFTEVSSNFNSGTIGWTGVSGTWAACDGKYCATGTGDNIATAGASDLANYAVTATVRPDNAPNGSGVDLISRVQAGNKYYIFELLKDAAGVKKWILAVNRNGTFSVLNSGIYDWKPGVAYTMRLETNLSTISAAISTDGSGYAHLGSVRLPDLIPGTHFAEYSYGPAGLRTWGGLTASFDDVTVTNVTPSMGLYTGPGWKGVTIDAGTAPGGAGDFCTQSVNDYCAGGHQFSTATTTVTTGAVDPLPASAYMNERWNDAAPATRINSGAFHYVMSNLTPGVKYSVRLHFAEIYYTAAGQRTFTVAINGTNVLTNFDKVSAAGGANRAVIREFDATANTVGNIDIGFLPGTTSGADHNPTVSAIQIAPAVVVQAFTRTESRVTDGTYTRIYNPDVGAVDWYINDHTIIQDVSGTWHMFGITDTEPPHAGGEQTFAHATAPALSGPWTKQVPALTASPAYGETYLWAPHVIKDGSTYYMFYAGGGSDPTNTAINLATSTDLFNWTRHPGGSLFSDGNLARDPFVLKIGSKWVMYYTASETPAGGDQIVAYRTSSNLTTWSAQRTAFTDPGQGPIAESPYVVAQGGSYYLFVGPRGPANAAGNPGQSVYKSDDPLRFDRNQWVGHLSAHCPEIIQDGSGNWFATHAGWGEQGLWIAPLSWNTSVAVKGYTATGPNYRATVLTQPNTRFVEYSVAMSEGGWRNMLDRDGVPTGPTMGVGSFGRTDVAGTAASSSLGANGRTVTVTNAPLGNEPVNVGWSLTFKQRWVEASSTWHVTGATTGGVYEAGWNVDTAATPTLHDNVADNRAGGDVAGFPQWTVATDTAATFSTAYRNASAWSTTNRWYAHGYAGEGIVAWQSRWSTSGGTWATGNYNGGIYWFGATGAANDKPFAQMLRAGASL